MAEWLTLAAAAARLRWHPRKVESRARREGWERRRANRGRGMEYLVPGEVLAETAEDAAEPDAATGGPAAEELTELLAETTELRSALAEERVARAKTEGELAAELRRSADLAGTVAALRAELLEARRPWLARLVEALRRRPS